MDARSGIVALAGMDDSEDEMMEWVMENSYLKYKKLRSKRRRRAISSIYLDRQCYGEFHTLYDELRSRPVEFKEYCRMLPTTFDYIIKTIRPALQSMPSTYNRASISLEEKLMVTLRYSCKTLQLTNVIEIN